jgi:hypothetical protein
LIAEHRYEGQRRQQLVVPEVLCGLLVEERGVFVLDGDGVLADLLPPHHVVVGVTVVQPDVVVQKRHE